VSLFSSSFSDYRVAGGLICSFPDRPAGRNLLLFFFLCGLAGPERQRRSRRPAPLISIRDKAANQHPPVRTYAWHLFVPRRRSKSAALVTARQVRKPDAAWKRGNASPRSVQSKLRKSSLTTRHRVFSLCERTVDSRRNGRDPLV
jgi:hypothetical protein